MNPKRRFIVYLAAFAALIGLGGCTGMSRQDQNTLAGAGVGAAAGALLTDGSAAGTLGGAAAGGIIGRVITPDDNSSGNRQYRNDGYGYDDGQDYNRRYRNDGYDNGQGYDRGGYPNGSSGYQNNRDYRNGNSDYSTNSDWYGN